MQQPIQNTTLSPGEVRKRVQMRTGERGDVRVAPSRFPSLGYYYWFLGNHEHTEILPHAKPIVRYAGPTTRAVRRTFADAGFIPGPKNCKKFNVCWGSPKGIGFYATLMPGQVCNQMPGSNAMGRKDKLSEYIVAAQSRVGRDIYGFVPKTYILPQACDIAARDMSSNPGVFYIYKPALGARGEGIRLLSAGDTVPNDKPAVLQQYISDPLLVNGFKFDLRIYVLITSTDPLIFYIYNEGLGRFATRRYRAPTLKNKNLKRMHLTNFSINATSDTFVNPDSGKQSAVKKKSAIQEKVERIRQIIDDPQGIPDTDKSDSSYASDGDDGADQNDDECLFENFPSKWKASELFQYLDQHWEYFDNDDPQCVTRGAGTPGNGVVQQRIFDGICDVIIKTIIACEPNFYSLGHRARTATAYPRLNFGIYGVDIMLRRNGSPVLIEVNSSPATGTSTRLDIDIKYPLIAEALNTIGIPVEKRTEFDIITPTTLSEEEKRVRSVRERNQFLQMRAKTAGDAISGRTPLRPSRNNLDRDLYLSAGTVPNLQYALNGSEPPTPVSQASSERPITSASVTRGSICSDERLPFNELPFGTTQQSFHVEDFILVDRQGNVRYALPSDATLQFSELERRICMQISDEAPRCGSFIRLFPTRNSATYMQYFEHRRYNTVLAMAYVCSGEAWRDLL
ncbi:Tubulin tyrosine ligase-like 4 [Giardia muris]|uniref:Tubulin--tyrosine ligase-like protein 5 n=1 Tax=Giardia muris TaxID=5742 RepID=A0A4Z1T9K2_GIAMU|nr:Tubulin tyrosine ligase-like 4 [Giardia muris]|eukprot:TNJ29211.1 Tubulin tyrosine ligase-like 4 [Giardia muris]